MSKKEILYKVYIREIYVRPVQWAWTIAFITGGCWYNGAWIAVPKATNTVSSEPIDIKGGPLDPLDRHTGSLSNINSVIGLICDTIKSIVAAPGIKDLKTFKENRIS